MTGGGPFRLPPGAWTDDTSMALCLAESLITRQGFDPIDQLDGYVRWYRDGHLSSTGKLFDIGKSTREALVHYETTGERFPGDNFPYAAGNGALMRLAPVALAYSRHARVAVARAAESARTTHGSPDAVDACRYFGGLLVAALSGVDRDALVREEPFQPYPGAWAEAPLAPAIATVAAGTFLDRNPPAIKGSGYVASSLEAALWALAKTNTFEAGVLRAVNLGHDADTTAAIYGQLAGALYGVDAIPERWRRQLVMHGVIVQMADDLYALAQTIDPTADTGTG